MRLHIIKGGAIILLIGILLAIFFRLGWLLIAIGVICLIVGALLPRPKPIVVRRAIRRKIRRRI